MLLLRRALLGKGMPGGRVPPSGSRDLRRCFRSLTFSSAPEQSPGSAAAGEYVKQDLVSSTAAGIAFSASEGFANRLKLQNVDVPSQEEGTMSTTQEEMHDKVSDADGAWVQEDSQVLTAKSGRRLKRSIYHYSILKYEEDPLLRTEEGQAVLKKLGLDQFVLKEPPSLNKDLCDEFLATYVHGFDNGYGVVRGRAVNITAEAVHHVTGLPLGSEPLTRLSKRQGAYLTSVIGKRVYANVYDLNSLKLCQDEEENKIMLAIAGLMMEKMSFYHYVKNTVAGRLAWGLHRCCEGAQPQWAAFMADMMRTKARLAQATGKPFAYGTWLTAIIESAVERGTGYGIARPSKEEHQVELYRKDKELRAREEAVKVRERELKKLAARCAKFAETLRACL